MNKKDTFSYKGNLSSDSTVKRALTIWAYCLFGSLIIYVGFLIVFGIFGFMLAMFGLY